MCKLAGRDRFFVAVRNTVNGERAHAANTFATIMVEVNGLAAAGDDAFVDDIEHL